MTEDYVMMLLFLGLIFFGTLSIYPVYAILEMLHRRRQKKKRRPEP